MILIGIPFGAKLECDNRQSLDRACSQIAKRYRERFPEATEWQFEVIVLHRAGVWALQLVHLPAEPEDTPAATKRLADSLETDVWRIRSPWISERQKEMTNGPRK